VKNKSKDAHPCDPLKVSHIPIIKNAKYLNPKADLEFNYFNGGGLYIVKTLDNISYSFFFKGDPLNPLQ